MKKIVLVFITLLFLCTSVFSADGVWTNLSDSDAGNWTTTHIFTSIATNSDGNIFTGFYGAFGIYDPVSNIWTDLSSGFPFGNESVGDLTVHSDGNVYLKGNGDLYVYNPISSVWTSLDSTDTGDWVGTSAITGVLSASDGNIYTGHTFGKFGVYDPDTNVWSDLSATDAGDWVNDGTDPYVRYLVETSDGNIYTSGTQGHFGVYSPTTNVWADLRGADAGDWIGTGAFTDLALASDGNIYAGLYMRGLIRYSPTTNTWTDLSTTDAGDWVGTDMAGAINSILIDSHDLVYTGIGNGRFGVYDPDTNVWSDISDRDLYNWWGDTQKVYSMVISGSDDLIYTGGYYPNRANLGVYNPDINFPPIRGITFNMKDSLTEANLISVNMDFNEDYYDLTDQNSPLNVDFYEGSYSATFSKEHYDSNTDFEIVVDANKSITIYLTPHSIHEITFNVKDANTNDDLAVIDMDCNVDAYDLSSQTSPFSQEFYANEGNYSCDFSTSAYDSNTGFIVVADANNTYTVYLTHEINVFSSGLGTVADPYQLFTIEDLNAVRNYPNSNFVLSNDLDFSECSSYDNCDNNIDFTTGSGWQPLGEAGTSAGCTGAHPACTDEGFICTGTQNSCETGICGSWGCTWSDASSPETYLNGSFNGNNYFINNLFINTSIVTPIGLFSQTNVDANVYDLNVTDVNIITGGANTGYVGALIGYNYGTVFNVSSTGNITNNDAGKTGGLVGRNDGNINSSSSSVNILYGGANPRYNGGLVSYNAGNITESYADGSVTSYQYIGGLVSNNSGVISNSYSRVDLNAYNNLSGFSFSGTGTIINSYSADTFTYNDTTGLSPFAGGGTDVATGSFWDSNLSGDLNTSDSNAVGKTTIEMKTESTFTDEGWDFTGIWSIDPTVNDGYPINYSTEADPCDRSVDTDWVLTSEITCTDKEIDLGTGKLVINEGGKLILVASNIVTRVMELNGFGDLIKLTSSWIKIG